MLIYGFYKKDFAKIIYKKIAKNFKNILSFNEKGYTFTPRI